VARAAGSCVAQLSGIEKKVEIPSFRKPVGENVV